MSTLRPRSARANMSMLPMLLPSLILPRLSLLRLCAVARGVAAGVVGGCGGIAVTLGVPSGKPRKAKAGPMARKAKDRGIWRSRGGVSAAVGAGRCHRLGGVAENK